MSESLTVSIRETARLLGISRSAAYRAARRGELPVIRIGKRVVVSRARLYELIDGKPEPETEPTINPVASS
jgi:excisionase family DNA binding protein